MNDKVTEDRREYELTEVQALDSQLANITEELQHLTDSYNLVRTQLDDAVHHLTEVVNSEVIKNIHFIEYSEAYHLAQEFLTNLHQNQS